jgi:hypothetical protein
MKTENLCYYLIDPFERTITPVYYDGQLDSLYALLGCDLVTVAGCRRYDLFVDDEGLLKPGQKFFMHLDYPQPLAGKALVVGCDNAGITIPPDTTLEELEARVMWVDGVIWEDE